MSRAFWSPSRVLVFCNHILSISFVMLWRSTFALRSSRACSYRLGFSGFLIWWKLPLYSSRIKAALGSFTRMDQPSFIWSNIFCYKKVIELNQPFIHSSRLYFSPSSAESLRALSHHRDKSVEFPFELTYSEVWTNWFKNSGKSSNSVWAFFQEWFFVYQPIGQHLPKLFHLGNFERFLTTCASLPSWEIWSLISAVILSVGSGRILACWHGLSFFISKEGFRFHIQNQFGIYHPERSSPIWNQFWCPWLCVWRSKKCKKPQFQSLEISVLRSFFSSALCPKIPSLFCEDSSKTSWNVDALRD